MLLLDGTALQFRLLEDLRAKVSAFGKPFALAIVHVGDREESNRYIKRKVIFGEKMGVEVRHVKLSEDISEEELLEKIEALNHDDGVTGIIVQLPLPSHISVDRVVGAITPEKDVDGLVPGSKFTPATPKGVMTLLHEYGVELPSKQAVVMGRSRLVGAPVAELLRKAGASVEVVHSQTLDPQTITRTADILVVAIGKPKYVTKDFIKEGAVVVDVGINVVEGKLVGDVDFNEVHDLVSAISPVPGGVGPMTIYSLFENMYLAGR